MSFSSNDPEVLAFQRKFDATKWDDKHVVEQANLVRDFLLLRNNLAVAEAGRFEGLFQRKLRFSRDEWFRLIASYETERIKLLQEVWEKSKLAKQPIQQVVSSSSDIFPQDGWLGEYLYDYGGTIESPDSFIFWSGIAVLSAVVRRKLYIKFGPRNIYPNFYIIFVAKSGAGRKGAPIKMAEMFTKTIPDINFIDRTTTERLPHDLSRRITTVGGQMQTVPCDAHGFLCAEELVAFIGDQSYNADVIKFLIEWWDCPDEKKVRSFKHGVIQLDRIHITLLGGTTPDWLQGALNNIAAGGGMLNRTLFVVEERTPKMMSWPVPPDSNVEQRLIQQLAHIDTLQGEFAVTEEALIWTDTWYKNFRRYLEDNEGEAPALERKQIYMIKLAMLLAVSEEKPLEITSELLSRATRILDDQQKGLPEIARTLMAAPLGREHLRVLSFITKAGGKVKHSDLLRRCSPYGIDKEGLKKIIETLEESDQIRQDFDATARYKFYELRTKP